MNWITTNIRIPEDVYMDIKMIAAQQRKSVAEIIRERLTKDQKQTAEDVLESVDKIGKKIAQKYKNINLTKALIDMRYEQ
ncbi:MAG: hypothetical protein AAB492_04435 [Patescibacteria group bacterium]